MIPPGPDCSPAAEISVRGFEPRRVCFTREGICGITWLRLMLTNSREPGRTVSPARGLTGSGSARPMKLQEIGPGTKKII